MATNNELKAERFSRFADVAQEPNKMLLPIGGYEKMKLVPLEEAVMPLVSLLPAIQSYAYVAKQRCKKPVPDGLTIDESAAIMLYTMQWEPSDECLFSALNKALRTENRSVLKSWFLYLKLVLTALSHLPSTHCFVYRGVKLNLQNDYPKGTTTIWWGFSSCTKIVEVLQTDDFYGKKGARTLFTIECINAKDISRHSYFPNESEMLLLPATQLEVVSSLDQGDGLCTIQLRETLPPVPLLRPVINNAAHSNESHSKSIIEKWSNTNDVLPSSVDLRQLMSPVKQQLTLNGVTGNAFASAFEFLIMKRHRKSIAVSRLFIYYNSRLEDGQKEYSMSDTGTLNRSAAQTLKQFGCCKEDLYPYITANVNKKPPPYCYSEAMKYRVTDAKTVEVKLDDMKACLAEGYPFVFGLKIFNSIAQAERNGGRVPTPRSNENQTGGWHALLAVGYSDGSQCFIAQNSWGEDWGDKGYCYIPYDYMCNTQYCQDLHSIRSYTEPYRH